MSPLEFAHDMLAAGVPVFVARRAQDWPGGGTQGCGYHLPRDWQQTPCDASTLASWRPGDGLCAVGGHGIDFVDVDPRHGGDHTWQAIIASGVEFPIYAEVATVSGEGRHYYVADLGMRSREDSSGVHGHKGIDVRAGTADGAGRGFVWLPGTERVNKNGEIGTYRVLSNMLHEYDASDGPSSDLRAWFAEREPRITADDVWGEKAKDNELGVPVGNGDHDRAGARFAARLAALGMRWEYARVLLAERIRDFVDVDPRDPFTEADIRKWWRGAVIKFAPPEAAGSVDLTDHESVRARFPALSWTALFADQSTQEWLVEPVLPRGRGVVLYSEPKMGKSLLALEIAAALATGRDVLGVKPERPVRVLYIDHENDPLGDTRVRLARMGFTADDERLSGLVMLSYPSFAPLDTPRGGEELLAAAQAYQAELVIVDTTSRTIEGEENSNDTFNRWYQHSGKRLKSNGIAYLRLDHSGHAGTHQRGASAKTADVDMVWQMTKGQRHDDLVLKCTHTRLRIHEETIAMERVDLPRLTHKVDAAGRWGQMQKAVQDAVSVLEALPRDATARQVMDAIKGAGMIPGRWANIPNNAEPDRRGLAKRAWDVLSERRGQAAQ